MWKKSAIVFTIMMLMFVGISIQIFSLTTGSDLKEAADRQSTDRLVISSYRGTIYDHNMKPMVNKTTRSVAAVAGGSKAAELLSRVLPKAEFATVADRIAKGIPFAMPVPEGLETKDVIDIFDTPVRYSDDQSAPHVIGYTDGSGMGVTGMEKAFDSWLTGGGGEISISYKVDAYGRALAAGRQVNGTYKEGGQSIVLTLDERIQALAEQVARDNMEAGAVVVAELPNCDIRAMVSAPDFSVTDLEPALNDERSPLLNRAVSAYNAGSVFKLVTAAAALENGISEDLAFDCKGYTTVVGRTFKCNNEHGHGMMDMEDALAQSCNNYFIRLAQQMGAKALRTTAERLGLGRRLELAPGMYSAAGRLPTEQELSAPHALANFSFGQGDLMVTPLQMCAVIQTIVNDGYAIPPSLVERTLDRNGQTALNYTQKSSTPVISKRTATLLKKFMVKCVENGTGRPGFPDVGGAGAKTGTAETGWKKDSRSVTQAWYTGFYPAEQPRYAIIVLTEDGHGGGSTSGPVFKAIANGLAKLES